MSVCVCVSEGRGEGGLWLCVCVSVPCTQTHSHTATYVFKFQVHVHTHTHRHRQTDTSRHRHRHRHRKTDTDTDRQTQTPTDRQDTDRHKQAQTRRNADTDTRRRTHTALAWREESAPPTFVCTPHATSHTPHPRTQGVRDVHICINIHTYIWRLSHTACSHPCTHAHLEDAAVVRELGALEAGALAQDSLDVLHRGAPLALDGLAAMWRVRIRPSTHARPGVEGRAIAQIQLPDTARCPPRRQGAARQLASPGAHAPHALACCGCAEARARARGRPVPAATPAHLAQARVSGPHARLHVAAPRTCPWSCG